jgi:lipopolysaccharide transport system permease protein
LIGTLVRRDLLARYRGSFFGSLWAVLQPLLQMALYYFVFGEVLKARFPGDPTREGFALYFMAGMLPWLAMVEALGRAPGVLAEHRNLIQKLVFPVEALPVSLVGAGLAASGFGLAVFLGFMAALRGGIPGEIAWLPVVLVPQVLLTLGLAWLLAALGAYLRDLGQVIGFLLTLWFFLTPICYPDTAALPRMLREANPLYALVRGYRRVLLEGAAPDLAWLAQWTAVSMGVFWIGSAVFHRLKRGLADAL